MEAKFLIRPKDKKDNYVLVYVTLNGIKYRFSTPYTVMSTEWESGLPKMKNTTKQLRSDLSTLKIRVDDFIDNTIRDKKRVPTKNELQDCLTEIFGKAEKTDFKSLYKKYLESKTGRVVPSTIDQIEISFKLLFGFNNRVELNDINQAFGQKFTTYLVKKDFLNVTVNKHHKNVKAFLNWCYMMDYSTGNLSKYFRNLEAKEKSIIAIAGNELTLLEKADLDSRLDKIRDLFLMSCYTGLRYSDVIRVSKEMIQNGELHVMQQKTRNMVQIPILSGTQRILTKYGGEMPALTNQKANLYLKDLFRHLGIKRMVFDDQASAYKPLHELITFHIGRKTFITIALTKGVNSKVVQAISGHKKDNVFNRYIAFSSQTRISELSKMEMAEPLEKA